MKCYHCGISFDHEGDPIDGNDFCSHICSGDYIQNIQRLSMATGRPPSQVARMHRYILKNFEKEEKEEAELRELRSTVPDHHKYTDEEIRQIRRCDEHYYNLPLGMKSEAYWLLPDPRVPEAEKKKGRFAHLWKELGEIPVNNDDELEKSFLHFEAGTSKLEVWSWFEEKFGVSLSEEGVK